MRTLPFSLFLVFGAAGLLLAACGNQDPADASTQSTDPQDPQVSLDGAFESAPPGGQDNGNMGLSADASENGATAAAPQGPADASKTGAESVQRAIEEADIIKVDGDTLYALSQYGGLSVIDIGDPSDLRLLGRHKVLATPFEMYVREGMAFVLYNGYGEYDYDEKNDTYTWYQTSYVVALDTSDPSTIKEAGRFPVAGYISDSRIVGDILYVAAFEDGYCWGCGNTPKTNLISLDVSSPKAIAKVDELSFDEPDNTYGWKKSLSSTDSRLYIAGPAWGAQEEPEGSEIQIVDISDAGGDMKLGASVTVAGQIESRWQMDEHEGVLRVISQPFAWRTDMVPVIETFSIESSEKLTELGQLSMKLPRPERLQTVRFDGERAYAITFEQTDPLFTIDLSDPAFPKQAGELEMPGWVYYMHPAGERVLGLGFDQGNSSGGLTVSLFDVSDLSSPAMLDRVNFGGQWASLAEDQDRIHKAFNILDDQDLILVPFSGWSYPEDSSADSCAPGQYQSGVQLIDWDDAKDALTLRGVAPSRGQARRGFIHDDHLFAMSDDRLETFDIDDRDAPATTDGLSLALRVNQSAGDSNALVRIGYDWWSGVPEVTVSPLASAMEPEAAVELELPQVGEQSCNSGSYLSDVRAGDGKVYVLYQTYDYNPSTGNAKESTRIITLDTEDPAVPKVVGDTELGFRPSYYYGYTPGLVSSGVGLVSTGNTLVFSDYQYSFDDRTGSESAESFGLQIVDMKKPKAPSVSYVKLPLGLGATGLLLAGNIVSTSHFEESPSDKSRVRFYLDRVDISDPAHPEALPKVNIPGSLLAYDAASENAITVDYHETLVDTTARQCAEKEFGWFEYPESGGEFDYERSRVQCHRITQTLRLVTIAKGVATVVDSYALAKGESVGSTALGDDRAFVALSRGSYYYRGDVSDVAIGPGYYGGYSGFASQGAELLILGGLRSGSFEASRMTLDAGDSYYGYISHLVAAGKKALVDTGWRGQLTVIDAKDALAPKITRQVDLAGYLNDLDVIDNVAVASMGYDGLQVVPLD